MGLQPIATMGNNPIPPAVRLPPPPAPVQLPPSYNIPPIIGMRAPAKRAEPTYADGSTIWDRIAELEKKLPHRRSRFAWRRRRAYAACLALIELRHQVFDLLDLPPGIPEPGGLPLADPSNRSSG